MACLSFARIWAQLRRAVCRNAGAEGTVPHETALVAGLAKAHGERRPDEKLLVLSKPKLLIVDELGYLPLEPDAAHLLFQLVSRRYETGAMLITSNRSVAEWGTVFADPWSPPPSSTGSCTTATC